MDKLGKYWGTDLSKPVYQKKATLDAFYQDVTYLDLMINERASVGLNYQESLAWAQEKIDLVGVNGLTPVEIRVATENGLISGEV